jgi:hypothetical protein
MADVEASESMADETVNEGGVLGNLPRTRPQRATPRRAAARDAASRNGGSAGRTKRSNASSTTAKPARGKPQTTKARPETNVAGMAAKDRTRASAGGPAAVADSAATAQARTARDSQRPSSEVRAKRARAPKRAATQHRAVAPEEPAPRQGYECEGERAHGPVQPPGGPELIASAAELVGELAKAGISTGERLLRDAFSRLPGS